MKKILMGTLIVLSALTLSACRGNSGVETFELLNRRADHARVAYVHDDHWDGNLPNVEVGQSLSLGANIIDANGNQVTLDQQGHHTLTVELAAGAPEGIVEFGLHGDHVHVIGVSAGLTQIVFSWVHDGEVEFTTPAINVIVVEGHGHDDHDHEMGITTFEILNRRIDGHPVAAYVHGDHWHGTLPNVVLGESASSLGANIVDAHGEQVTLDSEGHHTLMVALASGAPEGVVEFGYHGDHVHIIGVSTGLTQVVFSWVHDGEVEFTTPAINVLVVEGHSHDHDHDHDMTVTTFEILNRRAEGRPVAAYLHGDHWHGGLPNITLGGQSSSLGVNVIDGEGHTVTFGGESSNTLYVRLADGAPEGIVEFGYHGDHVHIIPVSTGLTQVVFEWRHDGEVEFTTPAINVLVVEDHDHDHDQNTEVSTFEILNRRIEGRPVTAYVDGDHWHGSLPNVVLGGQTSSLGLNVIDGEGNTVLFGGETENTFYVRLAEGAPEGVVEFGYHGDHVHIIAGSLGTTQVVFEWRRDGEVVFTTPAISVTIIESSE